MRSLYAWYSSPLKPITLLILSSNSLPQSEHTTSCTAKLNRLFWSSILLTSSNTFFLIPNCLNVSFWQENLWKQKYSCQQEISMQALWPHLGWAYHGTKKVIIPVEKHLEWPTIFNSIWYDRGLYTEDRLAMPNIPVATEEPALDGM